MSRRLFTGVIFCFRELFPYFSRHIVELIPASGRYAQRIEVFLLMTFFSQISSLFSSGSFFSFLIQLVKFFRSFLLPMNE
jgi:hypothetical protein